MLLTPDRWRNVTRVADRAVMNERQRCLDIVQQHFNRLLADSREDTKTLEALAIVKALILAGE
jgi:hypothetical protein